MASHTKARKLHLRLDAILKTSPLGCAFIPPSPSRSCSAPSMLSRSCSSRRSSLHKKDQKLPQGGHIPSREVFLLGYSLLNSHSQLLDFALNSRFYFALLQGVFHKESFQNERHEDTARNNEHNYIAAFPYWLPPAPDFGHQLQSWCFQAKSQNFVPSSAGDGELSTPWTEQTQQICLQHILARGRALLPSKAEGSDPKLT